jgi:hypothetical protein
MKSIYSLKNDLRSIERIQEVTLSTDNYGIDSERGLFGSKEWWVSINNNDIEVFTLEGIISSVYMSGHNDFPEFKVTSDGDVTSWERKGNETLYKQDDKVKLEYVNVKNRFDNKISPLLINVWVS